MHKNNNIKQRYEWIGNISDTHQNYYDHKYRLIKCYVDYNKLYNKNKTCNNNYVTTIANYKVRIDCVINDTKIESTYDDLITNMAQLTKIIMSAGCITSIPYETYSFPSKCSDCWTIIQIYTIGLNINVKKILDEIIHTKNIVNGIYNDDYNTYFPHNNVNIVTEKDIDWIKQLQNGDKIVICSENKDMIPFQRRDWIWEVRYYKLNRLKTIIDKQYNKYSKMICDYIHG